MARQEDLNKPSAQSITKKKDQVELAKAQKADLDELNSGSFHMETEVEEEENFSMTSSQRMTRFSQPVQNKYLKKKRTIQD